MSEGANTHMDMINAIDLRIGLRVEMQIKVSLLSLEYM